MFVTLGSMVSADETSRDRGGLVDVQAEALEVVLNAGRWQLTETRWHAVEQALTAMDLAVEAGDLEALEAACADLVMIGPTRIIRIGADLTEPPPPVRDRLNRLVHSLRATTTSAGEEPKPQAQSPQSQA